jgi:hypothetical protein
MILFICGTPDDAIINTDHTAPNSRINKLEEIWKKQGTA